MLLGSEICHAGGAGRAVRAHEAHLITCVKVRYCGWGRRTGPKRARPAPLCPLPHRERETKRAEHAALESQLEGQLRQMHTWDTQRATKQRAVEEYVQLVRRGAADVPGLSSCPERSAGGQLMAPVLSQLPRCLPQARTVEHAGCRRQQGPRATLVTSAPPSAMLQGKAEQLQRVNTALEGLRQRQESGEARLKVHPALPAPACCQRRAGRRGKARLAKQAGRQVGRAGATSPICSTLRPLLPAGAATGVPGPPGHEGGAE